MSIKYADIQGYEGLYTVSTDGRVFSPLGEKRPYKCRGYWRVSLWKKGSSKNELIHRLVACAFIPNPNKYDMVNHIDGNKLNNDISNLEWCNASMNVRHAYEHGLIHPKTTRVIQYTKNMEKVKEWESIEDACKALHLNHANVVTVCKQKTNRRFTGGYIWRYADDI